MTDLALSDEQEALRGSARAFLQRAWPPELVRRALAADGDGHDAGLWRRMAELGWVGLAFPKDVGGGGGGLLDLAVVYEEAGRALVPTSLYSTVEAALLIERAGDDAQRGALLRPVLAGERIVSVAYHEDGVRSSAEALATTAAQEGDVVVNGTKLFVPNAGVADDLVVVARDPTASGPDAVRLVVVPSSAPGVRRSRMGTFAHDAQHEVVFEAVRVPPHRVLAAASPDAWSTIDRVRGVATALQCVEMVGGARAVLDMTVSHVGDRAQFGRPIGSFQAVQHHVADLSTRIDAAGLAAWRALWCSSVGGGGDGIDGAQAAVAIAKVAAGDAYVEATLMAHQLHGAIGFTVEHDLHLWSDRARAAALTHGSREDHLRALGALVAQAR
jgi:alkylation response protein AidB-like acyl-CoA dehydrogenase